MRRSTTKYSSIWPLPGGAEQYAQTLREMLQYISQATEEGKPVTLDGLGEWMLSRYSLTGEKAVRTYAWFVCIFRPKAATDSD